jgi:hypothetical protein
MVKGRTDLPAAVARLALLVPPARVDLVDDVLAAIGRSTPGHRTEWPPPERRYELAYQVKRVHAGEVKLRGQNGEVVDVVAYRDKLGYDRKVYRLHQHGVFVGEYKTPQELGQVVDLATLTEDDYEQYVAYPSPRLSTYRVMSVRGRTCVPAGGSWRTTIQFASTS